MVKCAVVLTKTARHRADSRKRGGGGGGAGGKGDQGKADVSFEYYNGLSMFRNKKYYFLSLATS